MNRLDKLEEAVFQQLPSEARPEISGLFKEIRQDGERRKRILQLVKDALSHLRLDMKYLTFDLECTRRERDAARKGR